MTIALIMAGGESARMRSTAGLDHKALHTVLGVPLIERNICQLIGSGFDEIVVAINARDEAILDYLETRGRDITTATSASVEFMIESTPLGTIGVAGRLASRNRNVLIVNVDNLTTLDLQEFVSFHIRSGSAMTVAVHVEPFQIPFGQVKVVDGKIIEYLEKPKLPVRISSGTYVLTADCCRQIAHDQRTDVPDLITHLLERGDTVAAFEHHALWIDVNNAADIEKAKQLVGNNQSEFFTPGNLM